MHIKNIFDEEVLDINSTVKEFLTVQKKGIRKIETKSLEYDRTNFEQDLLKEDYLDRNLIAKWFFEIKF